MTEAGKGVLAMVAACTVWGLSSLYYKLLADVPPIEVLSHRTLWSLAFFSLILTWQRRLSLLRHLLFSRDLGFVLLAAVMISLNWFVFILSIQIGHAVEASLGYYIFPLVAVLIGMVAFKERLSTGQGIAVALALSAVLVLTWGLGVAPWVALVLAVSFGLYGLVKKRLISGPVVSVTAEVICLAPLAVIWLVGVHGGYWQEDAARLGAAFGGDLATSALLAFSGPLTAVPLMLFSYASKRVSMATLGLTQYINPTLQFLCATLIFAEPFTGWHMVAFPLIWLALAVYTAETLRQDRVSRRAAANAGTSPNAVT